MSYQILVLSDLHLSESGTDSRYSAFLDILKKFQASSLNELFLMGDIFDILIGPKKFWRKIHPEFFDLLSRITQSGKKITWVQGNHDFQLATLLTPMGIHWIETAEVLERDGLKILLSHGDLANDKAILHPLWRAFLTSPFMALFVWLVPENFGEKVLYPLSLKWSRSSRKSTQNHAGFDRAKALFRNYAERLSKKYGAPLILLGHSHIADDHTFSSGRYLNFGSWQDEPNLGIIQIENQHASVKLYSASTWLIS